MGDAPPQTEHVSAVELHIQWRSISIVDKNACHCCYICAGFAWSPEMEKCIAIRFNVDQNTWVMFKWMAKRRTQRTMENKQIWHASECTTCVCSEIEIETRRVTLKWIIQHSTNDTFVRNSKIHEEKQRQNYQNYSIWKDSIWRIEIIQMEGIQLMTMRFSSIFLV